MWKPTKDNLVGRYDYGWLCVVRLCGIAAVGESNGYVQHPFVCCASRQLALHLLHPHHRFRHNSSL